MSNLTLERLLEQEHAGWRALCETRGGTFYGELMTPDGLMVIVNGTVLDRNAVAASLNDSPPWSAYEILEPRLVELGPDCAVLVYRARASRGEEEPFVALMSSTYRVVDGRLRLALYQQTTATH